MSGTGIYGTIKSTYYDPELFAQEFGGISTYQIESACSGNVVDVPEFNCKKVMTAAQEARLYNKYEDMVDRLANPKHEKYAVHALRLGVTRFLKMKPEFQAVSKLRAKKKGISQKGFIVRNKYMSRRFATLTEAKKYAKAYYLSSGGKSTAIAKAFVNKWNDVVETLQVGYIYGKEVGEMKSMPKNAPKSYVVRPEYLYVYEGVVSDAEYEWM